MATRLDIQHQVDPSLTAANRDRPVQSHAPQITTDIACDQCGYNLRSLATDALCPECRSPVAASLLDLGHAKPPVSRAERRWALFVVAGIVGMLLLYPQILWVELFMDFTHSTFGNAPKLNVIGPKIWAMSIVQRSIGRGVESLGGEGTWLPLMNVTAVWLLTARRGVGEPLGSRANILRLFARWTPAALVGGYFGFLLNVEGTYFTDIALSKYAMIGVAGVELPGTMLLLAYLSHLATTVGKPALSRRFLLALIATFLCQVSALGMAMISTELGGNAYRLEVQIFSAAFQALCVVVGLFIAGSMLELAFALLPRVVPAAWRAKLS